MNVVSLSRPRKEGAKPKENTDYILFVQQMHNPKGAWSDNTLFIPEGTIVTNVRIKNNSDGNFLGYNFTLKETGLESYTDYPWNLLEYTPENMKILKEYREKEAVIIKLEQELKILREELKSLHIK